VIALGSEPSLTVGLLHRGYCARGYCTGLLNAFAILKRVQLECSARISTT